MQPSERCPAVKVECSKRLLAPPYRMSHSVSFARHKPNGRNRCIYYRTVELFTADSCGGIDIAFFSAGGARSREFAPDAGAVVIDNLTAGPDGKAWAIGS